jgi:hypothetical protein
MKKKGQIPQKKKLVQPYRIENSKWTRRTDFSNPATNSILEKFYSGKHTPDKDSELGYEEPKD